MEDISKTKAKMQMQALQELGIKLAKVNYNNLNLPESLINAFKELKKITSNNAIKRQKQYIGKLMRNIENIEEIKLYLNSITKKEVK